MSDAEARTSPPASMSFDREILFRVLRILFRPSTFSLRRLVVIGGFMVTVWICATVRWFFQALDYVLFPRLRDFRVEEPIFVIANPRSGTTFLHRLMSLDDERFTVIRTWQTIMPSVTLYAIVRGIARVDRAIGRPLGRLVHAFERRFFKGWDGVHHVGFDAPEEEQFIFISTLLDPTAWLMLPSPMEFRDIDCLDDLEERRRDKVMALFERSLRAHVFAEGRGKRHLLSKNVFHGGRLESLVKTFPDARFVHLVRHPYNSLASSMSMFTAPWSIHTGNLDLATSQARYFAEVGIEYYARVHRLEPELKARGIPFETYKYDDLVADPKATVEDIYDKLGLEMSDVYRARLVAETSKARRYESSHSYHLDEFGVTEDEIYEAIPQIFEAYDFERHPRDDAGGPGVDAGVGAAEEETLLLAHDRTPATAADPAPAE